MDQIDHFLHEHPLMLTEEEQVNDNVVCSGCRKGLPGPIYGCSDCRFYLHKSCAELPVPGEVQNFFHPCPVVLNIGNYTCNACFEDGSGFRYRCKRCDFDMHVQCALRPNIKSEGDELIHHFTHWRHPLTLVEQKKDLEVRCRICEKLCSSSSNSSVNGCEECNFFLHNSCMINIPRQINNFFHPSCPLILLTTAFDMCESCDESGSGLVFHCGNCDFQLDVKCALLPTVESKDADKIQHILHNHPLALRENKESDSEVRCRACGENCFDCCFGCAYRSCNFFLHKSCAKLPPQIHHPFHPQHPLALSPLPPDPDYKNCTCDGCLGMDDKFMVVYHCTKCEFILHIDCAKPKLTPLIKYGGHSHRLTFFDKTRAPIECDLCYYDAQSCYLRCVACAFNMHLYCHPSAPKTIKHECHLHPLTLTESPFEFEWISSEYEDSSDDDDEFYCDVCEEKRFAFESVYYCEECKFIAEVRCVLSELLPSLTKYHGDVNGRVTSIDEENSATEATILKLSNEIKELRVKEKPLKVEFNKLQNELSSIEGRLKKLERDHFLFKYQLDCSKNKYPTEASTFEGLSAYKYPTEASASEGLSACKYPTEASTFEGLSAYKYPTEASASEVLSAYLP